MGKEQHYVITINRLNGSGGREIGKHLAEMLDCSFLDKQILDDAARELGVTRDDVTNLMERKPRWWDDFLLFYRNAPIGDVPDERDITARHVYQTQCNIMKKMAAKENCVIVGRGAFAVFKDHPKATRIFLHAPEDFRVRRLMNKRGLQQEEARALLKKNDEIREAFTREYSGLDRYDARNYDFSFDVSFWNSTEEAAEAILGLID